MSQRRRFFVSGLVVTGALISPTVALGASNGTGRPLTGASTGVVTVDTSTNPSPETSTFSGHLSHVGAFTLTGALSFTPFGLPPSIPFTVTGTETLVAPNGDEIFGAVNGTGTATPGHADGTSVVTITGGTGRFSDASGTYTETSSLVVTFNGPIATGKGTMTIQGRISY